MSHFGSISRWTSKMFTEEGNRCYKDDFLKVVMMMTSDCELIFRDFFRSLSHFSFPYFLLLSSLSVSLSLLPSDIFPTLKERERERETSLFFTDTCFAKPLSMLETLFGKTAPGTGDDGFGRDPLAFTFPNTFPLLLNQSLVPSCVWMDMFFKWVKRRRLKWRESCVSEWLKWTSKKKEKWKG